MDKILDPTVQLIIDKPGTFEFYVQYKDDDGISHRSKKTGTIVVDPRLFFHESAPTSLLPLDGISILTIIPKWMPTINLWPSFFKNFAETGYNMVHFAPVSKRGISNSPYSIKDQLSICDGLFSKTLTEQEKHRELAKMIGTIHQDFNIFSVTDVVWNHTSCDSPWLEDHPEAGRQI